MSKTPSGSGQPRSPTETDVRIGQRIRKRRLSLDMRQEDLAQALEITQRQLQKYETGVNRISAARLVTCAKVLKVNVSWFYQSSNDAANTSAKLSEEETTLIDRYRALTSRSRKALLEIAMVLDGEDSKKLRE